MLFNEPPPIKGLIYFPDFVDELHEHSLITLINQQEWSDSLRNRQVQHYGFEYDYKSGRADTPAPPIPTWIPSPGFSFNQMIINEYLPGQGIAHHTDAPCYGDLIGALSLGSNAVMEFRRGEEKREMLLERGSLLWIQGEARHLWSHSIPARLKDYGIMRRTRVSITYRTLTSALESSS